MSNFMLHQNEDGTWSEYKEPYATIECPEEKDFERLKNAIELQRKINDVIKKIHEAGGAGGGFDDYAKGWDDGITEALNIMSAELGIKLEGI